MNLCISVCHICALLYNKVYSFIIVYTYYFLDSPGQKLPGHFPDDLFTTISFRFAGRTV